MKHLAVVVFITVLAAPAISGISVCVKSQQVQAAPKTYYVSTTGSNSNPGTREKPWESPAYGAENMASGDSLVILGGKYSMSNFDTDILRPPSGNAISRTIIKGEDGDRPVLAGKNDLYCAIDISGVSYITIENLEITSDDGALFRDGIVAVDEALNNALLEDLHIHHVDEFGVDISDTNNLQIVNCDIEYCGFGSIGGPEGGEGGWRNALVERCSLSYNGHYYQGGPGPSPYDRPDGFGIEAAEGPVEITRTTAEHNLGDGLDSKVGNTYINRCVVANNGCDGVKLWGTGSKVENTLIYGTGDGAGGESPWAGIVVENENRENATFEFQNVTVHDNREREAYMAYLQYGVDNPIKVTMRNCIFAGGFGLVWFNDSVDLVFENNIVYRPDDDYKVHANGKDYTAAELESGGLGTGNLSRDPMFINPAWGSDGDYRLEAGSPAIDSGSGAGAPGEDLEGKKRPIGGGYDIGAYEYGDSGSREFFFAEGSTTGGSETYLQLKNLGSKAGKVSIVYEIQGNAGRKELEAFLPGDSRLTIRVNENVPEDADFSVQLSATVPIYAENIVITHK